MRPSKTINTNRKQKKRKKKKIHNTVYYILDIKTSQLFMNIKPLHTIVLIYNITDTHILKGKTKMHFSKQCILVFHFC